MVNLTKEEAAKELIGEAAEKFINALLGIELLYGIQINDLDWKVAFSKNDYHHQIYAERLKGKYESNKKK